MSDSKNKHITFVGRLRCAVFGHHFITSRTITNHFKEFKCSKCNLELTNDEKGHIQFLTPELKEINETLVRFYQKKRNLV